MDPLKVNPPEKVTTGLEAVEVFNNYARNAMNNWEFRYSPALDCDAVCSDDTDEILSEEDAIILANSINGYYAWLETQAAELNSCKLDLESAREEIADLHKERGPYGGRISGN